ncbi:MAG: IclR family transcriptional regulator [Oscillospiraceae bacterium]|nr:IclR family transcriptional regulator [Oscillospiraceae bacterium]
MQEPKGPVLALGKAMELLELLLAQRRPMSLQEISARSGYPKSTAHALLTTLREYRMIGQDPDGRYRLGIRLYEYGCAVSAMWDARQLAHPYLEQLAQALGTGAYLAIRSGDHVLSIDSCAASSGAGLSVSVETGTPLPLHATAQGKLLLAAASEQELRRYCRQVGLQPYTRHSLTDPEALHSALAEIRAQGYAVEDGEYRVGLRAVAAPVYDATGAPAYAIGVVGLFPRVQSEEFQLAVSKTVDAAARLSSALGCP